MEYTLHLSNKKGNTHHGIGILIHKDLKSTFRKITDRISMVTIKEKNLIISIIAVYAPTSSNCDKNPKLREDFYEKLDGTIKKIPNRNFIVLAGDFNAKTGSGHYEYPENMGKYGKGHKNESGTALLEICSKYDLVITNTLFQHKLCHRVTWTAPKRTFVTHDGTTRENPIRIQIDYVIIRNRYKHLIHDARSYGGTNTETDHKMVICKINLDTHKIVSTTQQIPKTNIAAFTDETNQNTYKQKIIESNIKENQRPQEQWTEIVNTCLNKGHEVLGKRTKYHKYNDAEIEKLSKENKKLRLEIESCVDNDTKIAKKEERKQVKKEIKSKMKQLTEKEIKLEMDELENVKNDSNRYHIVMKKLKAKRKKKDTLIVQDDKGGIAGNDEEKARLISEHFQKVLAPEGMETNKNYPSCRMTVPFTKDEIEKAAKSLKNGKSVGIDNLTAEHIKYAPPIIHQNIANIFNDIAENGSAPEELTTGILAPLQKPPPKKKGPRENLRPIMLLSVIRKLLTICLIKRTWERIATNIPVDQAAYQAGRSTTEQVFTAKILIEKAITSSNFKLYMILLDMSKAFDTVDRKILFQNLEKILLPEEIHLFSILTQKPKIKVRINNSYSEYFLTFVGILQGDCLSAILFIYYLACCLKNERNIINSQNLLFTPKYADDITLLLKDLIDFREVLSRIKLFSLFSGLELNIRKTFALKLGGDSWVGHFEHGIQFVDTIKILGIYFSSTRDARLIPENIVGKIKSLERICAL